MSSSKNDFDFKIYLGFVLKELTGLQIYLTAFVIGLTICFLSRNYSLVPFIVPLFVQVIAKTNVKYRQRHLSALVELPAQAEDPVFIMDPEGKILLSIGKTFDLLEKYKIKNIQELLNQSALKETLAIAKARPSSDKQPSSIESYSGVTMKWYKVKAAQMGGDDQAAHVLVWLQDISLRKTYDFRLQDLLRYSGSLMHDLEDIVETGAEFEHLSSFLLKDYEAVFITRADKEKNLVGSVFKQSSKGIEISDIIVIPNESLAPINISRQKAQIISDDMDSYDSKDAFLEKNPLDPRVLAFLDRQVKNFITYNEADLSIIAFNYKSKITSYEKRFFEILVNNYRTMIMMVDLEKKRRNVPRPSFIKDL
ncbi:MAG: hypothetical protein MI892_31925 [Desulfobacterales bacterium]|nr:hypothetical protein [Desulfobacterales bacterium]